MNSEVNLSGREGESFKVNLHTRPWLLVAAYDVSVGESSEGYVAFNVLQRLARHYRIVLLTRRNNQQRLLSQPEFKDACPGVRVLGFDLPHWASWWKRGARFYRLYAYLWQLIWPIVLRPHIRLCRRIVLVHVLNFHNDSIPSSAWVMGRPVVWGPLNHNELISHWRREFWPTALAIKHLLSFFLRCIAWSFDLLLWVTKKKVDVILSAGPWVDQRLHVIGENRVIRLSQLGVDASDFLLVPEIEPRHDGPNNKLLVYAGRLDWLKGVDLAIEALVYLPKSFRLLLVGKGPSQTKLKQLVELLGLNERVKFHPPVPRSELSRIYAGADLFLFTSPEVAGLAWIESLACGLPVVGFAGNTEFALSGKELPGVYLVEQGNDRADNVRHYAELVENATRQEHDRVAIRAAALARYSWDRMVAVITSAYGRVS
jgi:glycosyltransferase involved in cell wall biosynthesis